MLESYSLKAVIDEVPSAIPLTSSAEKLIIIDPALKKAVPKKRMFHAARFFIVRNSSDGRCGAECTVPPIQIRDFNNDRTVAVSISYFATCDPGNEEKIAESLFDGPHPGAVLNEKINKYLIDYIDRRPADFIDGYFHKQSELQSNIAARAHQEIGLSLRVKVKLAGEPPLQPIPIGPISLSVRLRDCDENQALEVRGELQVDEANKVNAVLFKPASRSLEDIVKHELQSYLAEHISLHSFCTELNDGVKHQLIRHLNKALEASGRKVNFLALDSADRDNGALPFFETSHNVKCDIQQHPEQVVIKNSVQMIVRDLGRYRANGSPPLQEWVEKKLERVIHELLFDARYISLLLDFGPLEESIKRRLGLEAEAIGYGLKQLITVPDLEPLTWLKSFPLGVADSFETKSPGVKVKLELIASVRIKDLRDIRNFLDHRQDVPKLMKELVARETRNFLHTVDPERFYMRFSFSEPDELAVEEELLGRARDALEKEFHAEVIDIIFKVGDTAYIEHLRMLQAEFGEFTIGLSPVGQDDVETFVYRGIFRVEAVDGGGWQKFRLLNSTIEAIQKFLEESVGAKLETLSGDMLAYKNYPELKSMEQLVEKLARDCIVNEFGLVIRIPTIRRQETLLEGASKILRRGELERSFKLEGIRSAGSFQLETSRVNQEVRGENAQAESLLALIAELEAKRKIYASEEGSEGEVARLDKELARYRKMLRKGSITSVEKPKAPYASDSARRTTLEDFGLQPALPEGPSNRQLIEDREAQPNIKNVEEIL